jgi:hypothetical protein
MKGMQMSQDPLDSFIDQKKAESPYISLIDGDSIRIKTLKGIKQITKTGFSGEEVDCLRLQCVVETEFGDKDKNFDNSSAKFARELKAKGVVVGSGFTLTREGEGPKTTYIVTEVVPPMSADQVAEAAAAAGI